MNITHFTTRLVMTKFMKTMLTIAITGMLLPLTVQAQQGVSQVAILANSCATCHGTDGKGAEKIPTLKDLEIKDFIATMRGFQTGDEPATIMDRIAKGYTNKEIKLLAEYFAALTGK